MTEEAKETSQEAASNQQEQAQLPPVSFTSLVSEFAIAASAYLGGMQDPETKETVLDLGMAKRMIDTIELLEEKTKGNLTQPEISFLSNTLYSLRMTYVRMQANPPQQSQPTESEDKSKSQEA
jgi:hypothetical protein